jgi:hypothetical protein
MESYGSLTASIGGDWKSVRHICATCYAKKSSQVQFLFIFSDCMRFIFSLSGATLLVFANKQDLGGALTFEEISAVLDLNNEDIGALRFYRLSTTRLTLQCCCTQVVVISRYLHALP